MTRSILIARTVGLLLSMSLTISPVIAHGQTSSTLPQNVEDVLHQMSDLAGVIFIGQVTDIRRKAGQQGASGIVEVDFQINQAVRGCTAGEIYTLNEWAGLWQADDNRYRRGQRLLMMLHTPGPSGIASPVDGMDGAIPVRAVTSNPQLLTASDVGSSQPLVADLRWIATRTARPLPYSAASSDILSAASTPASQQQDTLTAAQQTPLSDLLGMLKSWQQAIP